MVSRIGEEVLERSSTGFALEDRLGLTDQLLETLFRGMLRELSAMRTDSALYLDALLQTVLVHLVRLCGSANPTRLPLRMSLPPARLRRVLEYIEANVSSDIGVAELAGCAAISPFHFSRTFAEATGLTPYAYLTSRRISRAKRMLTETDLKIADVASKTGFGTEGQFCRMFKRHTGVTPRRFRML